MTRQSVREDADAVRPRYQSASKVEKGVILDEFCRTTGYHRNAVMRLLRRSMRPAARRHRGRPRESGPAVVAALRQVWEASARACGKRLQPFRPELVAALERHGELRLEPAVREQLLSLSAATIDRRLRPVRESTGRRPFTQSRTLAALQARVPLRTFGEWTGVQPGACQADLVAHCGESTAGFYLTTLVVVDVATSGTDFAALWGKGQQRVGSGVHHRRGRLPVPLRELHVDNGGEFLNQVLYPWCAREGIRLTRGRPYRKNDQAYVEQKNGAVIRHWVGYDRYASQRAYAQLAAVSAPLRLYLNFFQPVQKLIGKERVGAKVKKHYDRAQTPDQRLCASGVLAVDQQRELAALFRRLNPAQLKTQIEQALADLWPLAERPVETGAGGRAVPVSTGPTTAPTLTAMLRQSSRLR